MFKWFNMLASVIMAPECKIMNAVAFSRALPGHCEAMPGSSGSCFMGKGSEFLNINYHGRKSKLCTMRPTRTSPHSTSGVLP